MKEHGIWTVTLGRWSGVQVRLHMFFLLFAVLTLYLSWLDSLNSSSSGATWMGFASVTILFLSVLIHEFGHLIVSQRLGGQVDEIVLGPLGGLGPISSPLDPPAELVSVTAGCLANLGVCFTAAVCLAIQGDTDLVGLMHPLAPAGILIGDPLWVIVKLTFWINWLLILVNLIPAYPFDGGRATKALLVMLSPGMDGTRAALTVARFAKLAALVLIVIAWLSFDTTAYSATPMQTWFALTLLAIFVFFSAKKEEHIAAVGTATDEAFLGYDFSAGYTSLERSVPKTTARTSQPSLGNSIVRWWRRRQAIRNQRRREVESMEDVRVDEILSRVHNNGLDSLTTEDRDLLDRVSARYRNRS